MPRRRTGRFVLEALFLAGAAAAVTVAELRPAAVIALMAVAWLVVALTEWASWLDEPHYGRGLPPRFYVPQVALPPSRPVEQHRYPPIAPPDDQATFEESVTGWAAALEEWPVLDASLADEETQIALPDYEPESESPTRIVLPPVSGEHVDEDEPTDEDVAGPGAELLEPEQESVGDVEPVVHALVAAPRIAVTAVHHIDPLASVARRRFLFRRGSEEHVVEVPDGPPEGRRLPASVTGRTGARRT